jgi:hypothetical protein
MLGPHRQQAVVNSTIAMMICACQPSRNPLGAFALARAHQDSGDDRQQGDSDTDHERQESPRTEPTSQAFDQVHKPVVVQLMSAPERSFDVRVPVSPDQTAI